MKPKRHVHVTIEVADDGTAQVLIPHHKNQQRDANAAADFTDALSKAIGKVEERHIGDHEHHHSDFAPEHTHDHIHH